MKKRLLYFVLCVAVITISSCCDCDEPIVYTISSEDVSILPSAPDRDSIKYKNESGNLFYATGSQNCDDDERLSESGKGKSLGCNCPDSKDDMCEYNLYINDTHNFMISFTRNDDGLSIKYIMNGHHITHTSTLPSFTLNDRDYSDVMVFEYTDPTSRIATDGETEVVSKTLYAPGTGLLQMVTIDGHVLKLAE
jgi:hypothetical protein